MSTPEFPLDPLAIVPDEYPLILSQSFGACCGLTALLLALEQLPEEERNPVKERMLKAWKSMWVDNFQKGLTLYNDALAKTTNSVQLPQPEQYQIGFNRALATAEKSARVSLGLD